MSKVSIREFKLGTSSGEGLHPYLSEHGAFLGGTPLVMKDGRGDFVPLPQRDLEIVLSAGFGIAVDLDVCMHALAALAKALSSGDYAPAAILLTQAQFPALPDRGAAQRMQKAAAMLKSGVSGPEVLQQFLPDGELAKLNPYHLGPGDRGGQFTTAQLDGASAGDVKPKGCATKLSADEILKRAKGNGAGWLQPKDVTPDNEKQCVSLVRAVIPELPHSSQWKEGDRITPENARKIAPGAAIATFKNGRYGNAPHGNHAAIFLRAGMRNGKEGIQVLDQFEGRYGDKGEAKVRFYPFELSLIHVTLLARFRLSNKKLSGNIINAHYVNYHGDDSRPQLVSRGQQGPA
jgi:hypothetical protein